MSASSRSFFFFFFNVNGGPRGWAQSANTFLSFLKNENSKGVRNKLKVYWLKCLSVSQANEATCGCDNEIAVKRSAFRPRNRRMIPRAPLILLLKHNECHLESTMNTHTFSKVRKRAQGDGFIVNRFRRRKGPKKCLILMLLLWSFYSGTSHPTAKCSCRRSIHSFQTYFCFVFYLNFFFFFFYHIHNKRVMTALRLSKSEQWLHNNAASKAPRFDWQGSSGLNGVFCVKSDRWLQCWRPRCCPYSSRFFVQMLSKTSVFCFLGVECSP